AVTAGGGACHGATSLRGRGTTTRVGSSSAAASEAAAAPLPSVASPWSSRPSHHHSDRASAARAARAYALVFVPSAMRRSGRPGYETTSLAPGFVLARGGGNVPGNVA